MSVPSEPQGRLLKSFDCTQDYGPEEYLEYQPTQVVESPAGRYREAAGEHGARFGYRFQIEKVGQPHLAVIRYPDDKRRHMAICDGTCYDMTTGVFTGWAVPLSGQMLETRLLFWPRWTDCSVLFASYGAEEPAAVSSVEIHELEALPPLAVPGDPGDGSRRAFGMQWEDPCGYSAAEGAMNHVEWVERVLAYARHSGQNCLIYPLAWYAGPQFPSEREPSEPSGISFFATPDRKLYSRWNSHPADWFANLLERCEQEGVEFYGALTLLRLGSLMQEMNTDLEAIQAGAATCNNLLWNDHVQEGTVPRQLELDS